MNEAPWIWVAMPVLGGALGAVYLLGLWLTVRRISAVRRPAALLVSSAAARIGVLLAAFWLLSEGRLPRIALLLAGFVLVRTLTAYWVAALGPGSDPREATR